jgi:hypothetical protein
MLKLFSALFGFLDKLAQYFTTRQLMDAGKAEKTVEQVQEVETRVEQAERAVRTVDPERTDRLRNRFDRSRGV